LPLDVHFANLGLSRCIVHDGGRSGGEEQRAKCDGTTANRPRTQHAEQWNAVEHGYVGSIAHAAIPELEAHRNRSTEQQSADDGAKNVY
jgi:hypothetical protein